VPDNGGGNTFAVTIDSNSIGVDEVQVWVQQDRTIDQLDCHGDVCLLQGGPYTTWMELTLVDVNGLTNHGEFSIDDIAIAGNITNTTGAEIEFEEADITGNLYNLAGATILCVYEVVEIDGDAENAGVIEIDAAASFIAESYLNNTGEIQLDGGECVAGIFDNNSTGVIQGFGVVYAEDQLLRNKGQIIAYGGSLAVASEGPLLNTGVLGNKPLSSLHIKPAVDVNNNGTIEVNAGGGVAFDCNLVNEPNGVIELRGGTLAATTITQKAGATFKGFGGITTDLSIDPNGIFIDPNGIIELTGPTNIVGDVTVEHNAVLEISDGQTLIVGHTTNNGEIRVVNGDVVFQGGYSGSGIVKKE
jgi:hypothetical protein